MGDSLEHVFAGREAYLRYAREVASIWEWPEPITASDMLAWFEDQLPWLATVLEMNPHDSVIVGWEAGMRDICTRLRALGISAGALPWKAAETDE